MPTTTQRAGDSRRSENDRKGRWLNPTVVALGMVSLFTDVASEMVMPLLPVFLTVVLGTGPLALGVIEGAAEATSSLLKVLSGRWADRTGRRKPLVAAGYTVSSVARPLIALATIPGQVLAARLADRVGKGLRTSPRDALIAASVPPSRFASAFGFHRAMDHVGALIGPLIAYLVLQFWTEDLRTLFWLSAIPGALAVVTVFAFVRDIPAPPRSEAEIAVEPAGTGPVSTGPDSTGPDTEPSLQPLLFPLALFTLGNASDLFLLLRVSETRAPLATLPLLWMGLSAVKALTSAVGGPVADALGRRRILIVGWLVYAAIYAGFAYAESHAFLVALFLFYGVHHGLTEGPEKALVAELSPARGRGAAFGWYHAVLGFGSLAASLLFGALWQSFGSRTAFLTGAGLALAATALLAVMLPPGGSASTAPDRAAPPP